MFLLHLFFKQFVSVENTGEFIWAAASPKTMHRIIRTLSNISLASSSIYLENFHFRLAIIGLSSTKHFHTVSRNRQSQTTENQDFFSSNAIQIPITFEHGHFKLYFFDRYEAILHYWQPIDALYETLKVEILPNAKWDRVGLEIKQIQKFRMYNQEEVKESVSNSDSSSTTDSPSGVGLHSNVLQTQQFRLSPTMPFGYLFVALNPLKIKLTGYGSEKGSGSVVFQFKISAETLKKIVNWSEKNSVGSSGVSGGSSAVPTKAASFAKHELLVSFAQHKMSLNSSRVNECWICFSF